MANSIKKRILQLSTTLVYLLVLFQPGAAFAQEANVNTFNHTIRWLNESNFPNYFLIPEIRDSINTHIKQDLIHHLKVEKVSFPGKVEYRIITGFGKPKNISSNSSLSIGYDIDLFSFLTRESAGYAVYWSVKINIRKDGKIIHEKEVKHEIENSNAAAYMTPLRWMSPQEFQKILGGLIREALGMESEYTGKIIVGDIKEKEKEISLWFPKSTRYLLKINGSWLNANNFSSQLVSDKDTVMQFVYRNKLDLNVGPISLKPILANLFSEATGMGTTYTIKEKERKRGIIEFPGGKKLLIQLNWIEEITSSTNSDEVQSRISVPLVGQLFNDTTLAGSFVYENISKILASGETKEKFSWAGGSYTENSFGTVVIHRIIGTLNAKPFIAEYNELSGLLEVKSDNQTLATIIFQNCNPESVHSFNNMKLSKNNSVIAGAGSNVGSPSLKNEAKLEWYPYFIKESSTSEDIVTSLEILVCLLFGIGKM